jgi:aminomethyltransferase
MSFVEAEFEDTGVVVCRTGYTGERGYELIALNEVAMALWDRLLEAGRPFGMLPCGLGARDTLRTEMGYPLHGQDISLDVTPNEGGLGWAVGWKKDAFWGKDALVAEKEAGPKRKLRGLLAVERGIPRPGMLVSLTPDVPLCEITSGTFSPTLKKGIGMALVPTFVDPEAQLGVQIRTRREVFTSTKLPFVDPSVRES